MIKMLGYKDAAANVAVNNLKTAKKFYEDTLGLKEAKDQELIAFKSTSSTVNVYCSEYIETNQVMAMTCVVDDYIEDIAQQLKTKGVVLEHYDDMQGITREGYVHVADNMKVVCL
jgi:catechol 2,3-dioxygenase-like lactoylglutathione lyase family enzyme